MKDYRSIGGMFTFFLLCASLFLGVFYVLARAYPPTKAYASLSTTDLNQVRDSCKDHLGVEDSVVRKTYSLDKDPGISVEIHVVETECLDGHRVEDTVEQPRPRMGCGVYPICGGQTPEDVCTKARVRYEDYCLR